MPTDSRFSSRVTITTSSGSSYPVLIGRGLDPAPFIAGRTTLLFYDRRLKRPGFPGVTAAPVASGESAKTFASFRKTIDFVIARDSGKPLMLVAYGGGAVGDMTGFVASTYRRGIPWIQMPTTLLAMVDASVGGKTAINHPRAKNMIGTIHQPDAVLADLDRLLTLPARQVRSGFAEVVKHGLIADARFFGAIESRPMDYLDVRGDTLAGAIERSVRIKGGVVARDERETMGIREILNFGHTLGHAIEAVRGYRGITHGEAISVGMVAAGLVSEKLLGFSETDRFRALLERLGLPTRLKGESARRLIDATRKDKKRRGGRLRMTLLRSIGSASVVESVEESLLSEIARRLGAAR